jgi:hypothetical protein
MCLGMVSAGGTDDRNPKVGFMRGTFAMQQSSQSISFFSQGAQSRCNCVFHCKTQMAICT